VKRFRVRTTEFLEEELRKGERVRVEWGRQTKRVAEGIVRRREFSYLIGKHNAYEIELKNGEKIYAKMQVLGEIKNTRDASTLALAALSGAEIYGYNDTLRRETGPLLVRISVQRPIIEAKDPKQYLRSAAIARNVPRVLNTGHIVSDLGPDNVRTHTYDIYITPQKLQDIDDQITRMKGTQHFLEQYGAEGLRALAEIHETLGNRKYAKILKEVAEKYDCGEELVAKDEKSLTGAFKSALRDYPKTDEFWEELTRDVLEEVQRLRGKGARGKSVENVERYAKRVLTRRGVDWREKILHTTIINKNLAKLWLYAMKRRGIIKSQNEEAPPRRAGPSRRP